MPQTRKNAKTAASCSHTSTVKHTLMQKHARSHTHMHAHTHTCTLTHMHDILQTPTQTCRNTHRKHGSCRADICHPLSSHTLNVSQNVYECTATRRGYLKNLCCRQFDFSLMIWRRRRRENTRCSGSFPVSVACPKKILIPLLKGRWIGYRIGGTYYLHQHPCIDGKVQFVGLIDDSRSRLVKFVSISGVKNILFVSFGFKTSQHNKTLIFLVKIDFFVHNQGLLYVKNQVRFPSADLSEVTAAWWCDWSSCADAKVQWKKSHIRRCREVM